MRIVRTTRLSVVVAATALAAGLVIPAASEASQVTHADQSANVAAAVQVPRYNHIAVIMDYNEDYNSILHYRFAPTINKLASEFGIASKYFTVSDPGVSNDMALLTGNPFGISDSLNYWDQQLHASSLLGQLDSAHKSWKEYVQNLPYPGYLGNCYPVFCQITDSLYNQPQFNSLPDLSSVVDNPSEARKMVPDTQIATDARAGRLPNFSFIVPNECSEMHGGPPWCEDSSNTLHQQDGNDLISAGDSYIKKVTQAIMSGPQWRHGNNAIVLTITEGDTSQGCCDVKAGTGHVLTVVITSHGPRHLVDATPFNHYSLLLTIEDALGLHCLRHACDKVLVPMAKLFGAKADQPARTSAVAAMFRPSKARAKPNAVPAAPAAASPWKVVASPNIGPNDNELNGISGRSPSDIWAVGAHYPNANATRLQTLAVHYNGTKWSNVPTPNVGAEANSLYGVAALPDGTAWATGIYTSASGHTGRALTEHWANGTWKAVPAADPGTQEDMLYSATGLSDSDVWAVGTYSGSDGVFHPLIEHWNGHKWVTASIHGPGTADGILTSVTSTPSQGVWATGQLVGGAPDRQVILHLVGGSWKVTSDSAVTSPTGAPASAYPQAISPSPAGLWISGNDRAGRAGFSTLVEAPGSAGHVVEQKSANPTPQDNYLTGVAAVNGGTNAWAVGYSVPVSTGNAASLTEFGSTSGGFTAVPSPNPGAANGGNTFVTAVLAFSGTNVWAVGTYDGANGTRTLVMHYTGGHI